MKTILVLTWTSFNNWSLKRLGLDELKGPNHKVIVFDISNILFKRFIKINKKYYRKDNLKIFNFNNKNKLIKELKEKNYDIVINLTNLNNSSSIYKEILKKKIKIIHFTDHKIINDFFFPKKIYVYLKYFVKKLLLSFSKKNKFEISFLGGNNIFNKLEALDKRIIYSHSINYDLTLRNRNKIKKKERSYLSLIVDMDYILILNLVLA